MKLVLHTLKLLIPALVPSWRFFDEIVPSPRIEYALLAEGQHEGEVWMPFCPRPDHVSFTQMLARMFWNPRWNETLFLVSCSERLMANPTRHSEEEIRDRVAASLVRDGVDVKSSPRFRFRLVFLAREGEMGAKAIERYVTYTSASYPLEEGSKA